VRVTCRMCKHQCISVQPVDMVRDAECPNCGHFTCEADE
jgi:hypothetical protein